MSVEPGATAYQEIAPALTDLSPTLRLSFPARERLAVAVVLLGALGVAFMWLHDTAPLRSFAEWLVAVGRLSGLEGTYALLVTVVLLARVSWIDDFLGMDRLFRWHGRLGAVAIWLLVVHAFTIIWGYSASFHTPIVSETRAVVLDLPDMLIATVGLALLVAVGVLSMRSLRRRLRYETWHFVHLYVYVAIALSFAHQFSTGFDFASHPLNRAVWIAMYAVTFGLLVWYRLATPVRRSRRHDLRVASVTRETGRASSLHIEGRGLLELRAAPGQFFIWRFLSRERWWQAHPFSISQAPTDESLRVTVGASGDFTNDLASLAPGTRVIAEGPFGSFTWSARRGTRALFVAAGSGIGPIRGILEMVPDGVGPTLVYRASEPADAALRAEVDELVERLGGSVHYLFGPRGERHELGRPQWYRTILSGDPSQYDVFLCGPHALMREVTAALVTAGFGRSRIHYEHFVT